MNVTPIFRSIRDPVGSAARWAVHSVPAHLSARGLAVPVWAALLLPAIALLPLASPWAQPKFSCPSCWRVRVTAQPPSQLDQVK